MVSRNPLLTKSQNTILKMVSKAYRDYEQKLTEALKKENPSQIHLGKVNTLLSKMEELGESAILVPDFFKVDRRMLYTTNLMDKGTNYLRKNYYQGNYNCEMGELFDRYTEMLAHAQTPDKTRFVV